MKLRLEQSGSETRVETSLPDGSRTFFICFVLVMMGLPCLLDPSVFLESSRAGAWLAWSFSAFWTVRLYFQWFVYPRELWRGKRM